MPIVIRKLQPHESKVYREIRLACLKNASAYFGSTYEEEILNPKLKFETFIENDSPDHFIFGAFDVEKLIGITGFTRMNRKRDRHRGELVQVYLDANYRGQNIGEKLIRSVVKYAFTMDGLEQIQLSAIASNQSAIKLYEKVGFRTFGVQPRYFKVGNEYVDQQFMQLFKKDYFDQGQYQ
jgi:RimJ/RimL family protein N-acetyltransferase